MTKLDEAVLAAAKWAWRYDDANPDVGMGPSAMTVLGRVLLDTGIVYSDFDVKAVLSALEQWRAKK